MIKVIAVIALAVSFGSTAVAQSMSKKYKTVVSKIRIDGKKLPLNFDNSQAFYRVADNGDGSSTASYEFQYRTKPGFMTGFVKGSFAKQLEGTLIGLKHYVETQEKVTPVNKRYKEIKERYQTSLVEN